MGKSKEWGRDKPPAMTDRVRRVILAQKRVDEVRSMLYRAELHLERGLESLSLNERAQLVALTGGAPSASTARARLTTENNATISENHS